MKVSIITPCFNSFKFLNATIDSVLEQTYDQIEHIVIDGGSTDGTLEIIKKYTSKNKNIQFLSEPDNGMYDAINKGLLLATGDIIYCLNSDDQLYDKNTISKVVDFICRANSEDGVSIDDTVFVGDVLFTYSNGSVSRRKMIPVSALDLASFGNCTFVPQPSTFFSRALFNRVGIFDLKYRIASDYDYIIRLVGSTDTIPLGFITTKFHRHNDSLTEKAADVMSSESNLISSDWLCKNTISSFSVFVSRYSSILRYIFSNPVVIINKLRLK